MLVLVTPGEPEPKQVPVFGFWLMATIVGSTTWLVVHLALRALWPHWGLDITSRYITNRDFVACAMAGLAVAAVTALWTARLKRR
jgi:hypothetical protein